MLFITRKEHFSASHILRNLNLNNEENADLFGKCSNLHGHNYYLEVTVKGTPDTKTGYVIDLKVMKSIINECIIDKVDHKFLNELDIFNKIIPTTENIAVVFWNLLVDKLKGDNYSLHTVKIFETEKNCVVYDGKS
ncbi:MAG: 6-pyruvoyl tetrahydropterin synthase family protein [Ignavibacteria bacterium]